MTGPPRLHPRPESASAAAGAEEPVCLSQLSLFRDLSGRERARLIAEAPRRAVAAGQQIWSPLRPFEVLFAVRCGRARLYRPLPDGREITTALPAKGSLFGEMPLIGLRMADSFAVAVEPIELCLLGRGDVARMLLGDPRIAVRVAEVMGARIADLEQRLVDQTSKSLTQRLAHTLLLLSTGDDGSSLRVTHAQLAGLVGATRERTTVGLGELAARELLSLRRGRVILHDRAGLATLSLSSDPEGPSGV